jgi:pimeloyl-ACP methyl ester carboxylesterase
MPSCRHFKTAIAVIVGSIWLNACTSQESIKATFTPATQTSFSSEVLTGSTLWSARVPEHWNGTLLLHSRGWAQVAGEPAAAPAQYADILLAQGYALAASNYGAGGWALAEAVPAQEQTIDAFARRYGKPARVIAYGYSMGGLVTTALVEKPGSKVDGGIAFCSSMGGALGMMNMGLDGAFSFRTLVAPDSGIKLVDIENDQSNGSLVRAVVEEALKTPAGRARIALAGVFGGIPGWTRADTPRPEPADSAAEFEQIMRAFPSGVFLPRSEQEQRTGGNFSWNEGIDYSELLDLSGRRNMVEALYREAGMSLAADLAILAAAPRISADPAAVAYMRDNYTPHAEPYVPLLAVQTIGDGVTSPSLQQVYADHAPASMMNSQYVERAGHCTFDETETLASLRQLEARLDTGEWPRRAPPFVAHEPAPVLRPCFQGKTCR